MTEYYSSPLRVAATQNESDTYVKVIFILLIIKQLNNDKFYTELNQYINDKHNDRRVGFSTRKGP